MQHLIPIMLHDLFTQRLVMQAVNGGIKGFYSSFVPLNCAVVDNKAAEVFVGPSFQTQPGEFSTHNRG